MIRTTDVARRDLLGFGAATMLSTLLPSAWVSAAAPLRPTPAQTEGPFYPVVPPAEHDNDLVRVSGRAVEAVGTILHLEGRVVDRWGRPIPEALVELWQCDAHGIYRHPRAPLQEMADPGFQGYGRTLVDRQGGYRFRTIRPVPYPGRTPHIHVAVLVPRRMRFVTQMYVAGEPLNERDFLYRALRDPADRAAVTVPLLPADAIEPGALRARFDLVLDL
ncbi:MAG: protocatechuate 3,4-dioxygenase [Geminicoccaceae bacterium]|nr:protocatechuate 3,4-dioxygenase [Geminicoccaceae bacterium]MCX7629198.1 protocatechuate 3,4-dioxygenase [Geminicoccaceae bacterium]MDW8341324.1 protocatechuate 3,4-dioxygenase [Geminicoccaceae bacterium]